MLIKLTRLLAAAALLLLPCRSLANAQVVHVSNYQFTPADFSICLGDTVVWIWDNGSHTTTSTTIPAGAASWNIPMTPTSPTYIYVPTVAGTYAYDCTPHASFMMASFTVSAGPAQPVINTTSTVLCGDSITLSVTPVNGVSYEWGWSFMGFPPIDMSSDTVFKTAFEGGYVITATDACGTSTSAQIDITTGTPPAQPVLLPDNGGACAGNTILLTAGTNPGATHKWFMDGALMPGVTGVLYNAAQSGAYSVQDSTGCGVAMSDTATVTIYPLPPVPVIDETHSGSTYTFSTSTIAVPAYQYAWDFGDGSIGDSVQNPPPHTYTTTGSNTTALTITDANGCSNTGLLTVQPGLGIGTVAGTAYHLSPNPANSLLLLQHGAGASIQLLDMAGRILSNVTTAKSGDAISIDVHAVPTGSYLLQIHSPTNGQAAVKIEIEH